MIRAVLAIALLAACAPKPKPVVTSGGASADGRRAWFAVTRGEELTIYRCEGEGCWVVPRSDEPARRMPPATEAETPDESDEEAGDEEPVEDEGPPEEERLDLMDGVL